VFVAQAGQRTIDLRVDGATRAITTRAVTVGEILRDQGIELAAADVVTPALDTDLRDGTNIHVRRGHTISLEVDGTTRNVVTTAETMRELRTEQGITDEFVSASASPTIADGATLSFRTARTVTIHVDGSTERVGTTAFTTRELLPAFNITLGANDQVSPALDERLQNDSVVIVTRVADDQRAEIRAVPFVTQERPDNTLRAGERRVIQEGQAGSQRLTFRQRLHNGVVVSEQLISTVTVQAPRPRIVAVGSARAATSAPAAVSTGGRNSESGQATWYDYTPGTCAHKTIPKGTVLTVINVATGASTTCVVADRGPYADGRIVDLTPGVFSRLAPLSKGVIDVRIEW
jgi:uncharacterized protein YabE (DUF348 family)